jgi:hypothetical protein
MIRQSAQKLPILTILPVLLKFPALVSRFSRNAAVSLKSHRTKERGYGWQFGTQTCDAVVGAFCHRAAADAVAASAA